MEFQGALMTRRIMDTRNKWIFKLQLFRMWICKWFSSPSFVFIFIFSVLALPSRPSQLSVAVTRNKIVSRHCEWINLLEFFFSVN